MTNIDHFSDDKVRLMEDGHCKISEYSTGPKLVDTFIEH